MNTTIAEPARTGHDHHGGHDHDCENVTIHVNNKPVFLHTGDYTVATLKTVSKVPLAEDLVQLVGTKLEPLPDDGHVHIHGCEIFISHVKDGGSS
jgi:hypothetical protein